MEEINEMEMPTRCDCGNWFDLHDGYSNHDRTKQICEDCYSENDKRSECEGQIESWEQEIESQQDEINYLKSQIEEYKQELEEMPAYK